ncbi:MAG: RNA polymerase sigma factor [Myxococcota bacterium]
MRRYSDGDSAAFDELFARYEQRAYGYFLRRTGSRDRASDLYQELFLRIHRCRSYYDPSRAFAPWFYRIAERLLVDDVRRAFRKHERPLLAEDAQDTAPDVECEAADRESVEQVLEQLSSEERFVLVSAKMAGRSYAELGRELGKSADAVKKLASRAMQRLRASPRGEAARMALASARAQRA